MVVARRSGQPEFGREQDRMGASLGDPNRVHVTLRNLTDLADLPIHRLAGDGVTAAELGIDDPPPRAGLALPAERWLLELLAVAAGSAAFVSPTIALLVTAVTCVVAGSAAFVASGNSLWSLPQRTIARTGTLLHPRSSLWAPAIASRVIIAALVLAGGVAAVVWVVDEDREGVVAAARAGAWTDGFRVAALLMCALMITSVGDGRVRRAAAVRRWAEPAGDATLIMLAVSCVVATVFVVAAVPHPSDPIASRADGLGLLPARAHAFADRVRDDIVTNELNSVASCLTARRDAGWQPLYSAENDAGAPDLAKLVWRGPTEGSAPGDLATVVLAMHNQLAPWVETIEVSWSTGAKVRVERADLPTRQPLTDVREVIPAATYGSNWLIDTLADRATVLRCSAGPVL